MKRGLKWGLIAIVILLIIAATAIIYSNSTKPSGNTNCSTDTCSVNPPADSQMANPASVYCEEHNGTLEIKTNPDGSQYGMCRFENGTECEEWKFFRGEC